MPEGNQCSNAERLSFTKSPPVHLWSRSIQSFKNWWNDRSYESMDIGHKVESGEGPCKPTSAGSNPGAGMTSYENDDQFKFKRSRWHVVYRFPECLRQSRQWQHFKAAHARRRREVHERSCVFVLLKQENKMRVGRFLSVGLMAACAVTFSAPAISAPLQGAIGNSMGAPSITEKVWCHHCGGGDGVGVGALIGGLVGGVIAAGAANAAAQQDAAAQQAAQQHATACAQRYHSYDPASNTFQAKDGRRLPCQ
jgi:hypothetical protein